MDRLRGESLEAVLDSRSLSGAEQSETIRKLGPLLTEENQGFYWHIFRPVTFGVSLSESGTWSVIAREETGDTKLGVAMHVRDRDRCVESVTHSLQAGSDPANLGAGSRLTVRDAALIEELAEHPERFIRYNPDDDGSASTWDFEDLGIPAE